MFKNNRPVIIGIFIFLGLAILFITVFTLGGQKKSFVKSFTVHAIFNDVEGLLTGGNVWFSGVKIGTIKTIDFYGDGQVEVTMNIENDAQSHIHKNAKAKIGSDGLIGNKIVVIYGGDATAPEIAKEDFLKVEKDVTMDEMMGTFQTNNKNLVDITTDFKHISKKIDSGNGMMSSLLNDPAIVNQLKSSMNDLQTTIANFKGVSVKSKDVLANLQDFTEKLNKHGNSLNDLVTDTILYSKMKATLAQLERSASWVTQLTSNLKTTADKLNQPNNPLGLLLNDSSAANSMQATLQNLSSASKKLDDDLEAAQHNFLLKGFFKKREKEKADKQ
jgi:phospholipid/cholesterol/gamma-HCH transport system substrate-binding protein